MLGFSNRKITFLKKRKLNNHNLKKGLMINKKGVCVTHHAARPRLFQEDDEKHISAENDYRQLQVSVLLEKEKYVSTIYKPS